MTAGGGESRAHSFTDTITLQCHFLVLGVGSSHPQIASVFCGHYKHWNPMVGVFFIWTFYKDLSVWKPKLKKREKKAFPPLVSSPEGHKGQDCTRLKPGGGSSLIWVSCIIDSSPHALPSSTALPSHQGGAGLKREEARPEPAPVRDAALHVLASLTTL